MNIESLQKLCKSFKGVTEDIKWGNDLCFSIAKKMFCVAGLQEPLSVSFKVSEEEFHELTGTPGIIPAPYVARYHWILVEDLTRFSKKEWEKYLINSYNLVKSKLPKKALIENGLL